MNNKFKIGDKIRCIDINWQGEANIVPVYQGIYTVKALDSEIAVVLEEIPYVQNNELQSFLTWHFEKATETGKEMMIYAKEKLKVKEFQNKTKNLKLWEKMQMIL